MFYNIWKKYYISIIQLFTYLFDNLKSLTGRELSQAFSNIITNQNFFLHSLLQHPCFLFKLWCPPLTSGNYYVSFLKVLCLQLLMLTIHLLFSVLFFFTLKKVTQLFLYLCAKIYSAYGTDHRSDHGVHFLQIIQYSLGCVWAVFLPRTISI
jgi:hypothetical protein